MSNIRDIINGAQLPRFINKPVSIIGKVTEVDPNGHSFTLESTDNIPIVVTSAEEINEPMAGCWVEVHGKSTGKGIQCKQYIIFNNEKFDCKGYNNLCKFIYMVPNMWQTEVTIDDDDDDNK